MDNKPGLSAPLPESEAHTLAASRASLSDDGKVSAAGEQTDVEVGSQTEKRDQQHDEKHDALARQATATSKTGKPLEQTATREDGTEYPTGMTLSLIVLALCLSVFTMALDNSIIATAIPKITDQFQSLPDVGWYASCTPLLSFPSLPGHFPPLSTL
jgi:hypothetical protein